MRYSMLHLLVVVFSFSAVKVILAGDCNQRYFEKCKCGPQEYLGSYRYVLNCTNLGFNNVSMLQFLPEQVEVLIIVGNNFEDLPWNVFGTNSTHSLLKVVDLSNNKIRIIRGKTFHHVPNVERLMLNFNDIDLAESNDHPRIFSNFENLMELHLTDAFQDHPADEDFAHDLHSLFKNGNLLKLEKLHLEQNEINRLDHDPSVFCDLRNVLDLYLGMNHLRHIGFNFGCLPRLRYIDLESNRISELNENERHLLDKLPSQNQSLIVNLIGNPFSCDKIAEVYKWFNDTKVVVPHKDMIKCINETIHPACRSSIGVATGSSHIGLIVFMTILLCICMSMLVYTNREPIRTTLYPKLLSLSRNIQYTTIGRQEAQEMDV